MVLTEKQSDAIAELINIAFARTASSLSEMSGYRVFLMRWPSKYNPSATYRMPWV